MPVSVHQKTINDRSVEGTYIGRKMGECMDTHAMPSDPDAERAVIGCLVRDWKLHSEVADFLTGDDFYIFPCRVAYESIGEMARVGRSVDVVTLADYLHSKGRISDCDYGFLVEIYDAAPSTANIVSYAKIVVEKSKRRRMIHGCNKLVSRAYNLSDPIDSIIGDGGELFFSTLAMGQTKTAKPQDQIVREFYEQMDRRCRGKMDGEVDQDYIPSGWKDLDHSITGFFKSELYLIAARPSVGKTVLAGCLAHRMASRGHAVLFCSLEQPDVAILQRMFSMVSKVPGYRIFRSILDSTDIDVLVSHGQTMESLPIWWVDSASQTVSQISSVAKRLKMKGRLDAVIIDYLQIIKPEGGKRSQNRADEVGEISWGLKLLARELQIPVISLAQLNRQVANRVDSVPKLSDLRDSGRLEQDADTVILLHKPEEPDIEREVDKLCAIVAKNRNGPLGSIDLQHIKETFDITDASGSHGLGGGF